MSIRPTTARFVPGDAKSPDEHAIGLLHLYAYGVAAGMVGSGTRVLDLGFGEGYGAPILIEAGADYLGLEPDEKMVDHARARYGARFETYDGASIPAADGAFDLVVAFQIIAFLADPRPWLREIRRVLVPDGTALITTPNRAFRLYEGQRPWNRHHAREYHAGEFEEVLSDVFSEVTVYAVHAAEPIHGVVRARGDRARKLARLDVFGLRYRLPETLDARLRVGLRRSAQPYVAREDFTLDRIWHDASNVERGLDFLAVVRP
jgi:SAM-dependent methyltransferase